MDQGVVAVDVVGWVDGWMTDNRTDRGRDGWMDERRDDRLVDERIDG